MIAKKVIFKGRVQGVCFRNTTEKIAANFKVSGYVKNLPNETGRPYSGDQVEMFIQGEKWEEISAVIRLVSVYFGAKHIDDMKAEKAKPDKTYKTFIADRSNEAGFYGKGGKGLYYDDYPANARAKVGAVLPIRGISPDEKNCVICHFMTGRRCPDCGEAVCGMCTANFKHTCKKVNHVQYDQDRFFVLDSKKLVHCKSCDKMDATLQCKTCKEHVCSKCGPSHSCGKADKKYGATLNTYNCGYCKALTHCKCVKCGSMVCVNCQDLHDCKDIQSSKSAETPKAEAPKKREYENQGLCVQCKKITTSRVCKDCGKSLCSICEDTTIDSLGNRLHDCKNQNVQKSGRGFVQSVRAALGF